MSSEWTLGEEQGVAVEAAEGLIASTGGRPDLFGAKALELQAEASTTARFKTSSASSGGRPRRLCNLRSLLALLILQAMPSLETKSLLHKLERSP